MSQAGFWLDNEQATKVVKELKSFKIIVEPWDLAYRKYQELQEILPLLKPEDRSEERRVGKEC